MTTTLGVVSSDRGTITGMTPDADRIRATWDAAAANGSERLVGAEGRAREQLERLFAGLGATLGGDGTCLDLGCGTGRMTIELADAWPEVVAVDVSPAMLERARERLAGRANTRFQLIDGVRLDGIADGSIATAVCFGVLQHVPDRATARSLLRETARVLHPDGEALVQLPVLQGSATAFAWRVVRWGGGVVRSRLRGDEPTLSPAYRGIRLTGGELRRLLRDAGLEPAARQVAHDTSLYSRYPHADDLRLRLRHAGAPLP
jgi:SAM-dependent methyltransferase